MNFSVFSQSATAIELLLFDEHDDKEPNTFHEHHHFIGVPVARLTTRPRGSSALRMKFAPM